MTVPAGAEPVLPAGAAERVNAIAVSGVVNAKWIDALPKLEIIANFGVGYDGVDAKHAATRNIVVTNTPDVLNDEVADTTIALLINTVRRLYQAETWLRDGKWVGEGPFALSPFSLRGRKVGLFGMGRIGQEIASGWSLQGGDRIPHPQQADGLPYTYYGSLKEMAEAIDILICIVPGTPETHKAINAEILTALGPEGVFINVGRGSSVDEDALCRRLRAVLWVLPVSMCFMPSRKCRKPSCRCRMSPCCRMSPPPRFRRATPWPIWWPTIFSAGSGTAKC